MSKTTNDYTKYGIHRMLVDALKDDGVICDSGAKSYDENGTFKGGEASRLAFKEYNDKIIRYHNVLKVLSGEQRADIHESIPAIDFAHIENTGLMNTYPEKDGGVDPSTIVPIQASDNEDALALLESDDGATINRAVMGYPVSEHFYNTKGIVSSGYNIQTATPGRETNYVFNGVKSQTIVGGGEVSSSVTKSTIRVYRVVEKSDVTILPSTTGISYKTYTFPDGKTYAIDDTIDGYMSRRNIILNTDCGFFVPDASSPIPFNGTKVVSKGDDDIYRLALQVGDVLVAIPKSEYSTDTGKMLVLKSNLNSETEETAAAAASVVEGWLGTDGYFYTDDSFTNRVSGDVTKYYLDIGGKKQDPPVYRYFTYDGASGRYMEIPEDEVKATSGDGTEFNVTESKGDYQCFVLYVTGFDSGVGNSSMFYEVKPEGCMNDIMADRSVLRILSDYLDVSVEKYAPASGLLNGFYCEPCEWTAGSPERTVTKWRFVDPSADSGTSLPAGTKYFDGHLIGRGNILDAPLALTKSDELEVGGVTYKAACSGETAHTLESIGIKGKTSLIYRKLLGADTVGKVFRPSQVDDWGNFTTRTVSSVVTKFDYSNTKYGTNDAMDLVGCSNPYTMNRPSGSIMKYKDKFYKGDDLISFEDIVAYIDTFADALKGDTLVIDARRKGYSLVSNSVSKNKSFLGIGDSVIQVDTEYDDNRESLKNDIKTSFAVSYNKRYKSNGTTLRERDSLKVSTLSPLEMVEKTYVSPDEALAKYRILDKLGVLQKDCPEWLKGLGSSILTEVRSVPLSDVGTGRSAKITEIIKSLVDKAKDWVRDDVVLLFPEFNKYFPTRILVISKRDLGLEPHTSDPDNPTRGTCGFLNPSDGKLLMFQVEDKKVLKFSDVEKVKIITSDDGTFTMPLNVSALDVHTYVGADGKTRLTTQMNPYTNVLPADNYIYILGSMDVSLSGSVDLRDHNDKVMELSEYDMADTLIAASYPDNYFKVTPRTFSDGTVKYEIASDHRTSDFRSLLGSMVLPGLPKFNDYKDLLVLTKDGVSMSPLYHMMNPTESSGAVAGINTVLKNTTYSIISDWPVSDSTDNPLRIKNIRPLLKGILGFENDVRSLSGKNISVDHKGRSITLDSRALDGFLQRFHNTGVVSDRRYSVSLGTYPRIETSEGLAKDVSSRLTGYFRINTLTYGEVERRSLESLSSTFDTLFGQAKTFDMDTCGKLDEQLGNGTKAFLNIGTEMADGETVHDGSAQFNTMLGQTYDDIRKVIVDSANEILENSGREKKLEELAKVRDGYASYFTGDSVTSGVTIDIHGNLVIDNDALVIDFNLPATRDIIQSVKVEDDPFNRYSEKRQTDIMNSKPETVWSSYSLDEFIITFLTSRASTTRYKYERSLVLAGFWKRFGKVSEKLVSEFNANTSSVMATDDVVDAYLYGTDGGGENINVSYDAITDKYVLTVVLPDMTITSTGFRLERSSSLWEKSFDRISGGYDVTEDTLNALVDFSKLALEGIDDGSECVRFVASEDEEPTGRSTSLYYKRYRMLNNRMNRLQGPLWKAASLIRNAKVFDASASFSDQVVGSYDRFMKVMPVSSIEPLTYMPTQKATLTTIPLDGKFYSDKELEAMKGQINGSCVLTCTKCDVKDSCPFYDQNEIIKMYCTGVESIDLWVKDNELNLISGTPVVEGNADGFDWNKVLVMHNPYSEVMRKLGTDGAEATTYGLNDLSVTRRELANAGIEYSEYVHDEMGWLLGGRYGTVERNPMKDIVSDAAAGSEYYGVADDIHTYRYLYDAVFINDENSYVSYSPSSHTYGFEIEVGPAGDKKLFKGRTYIKIPTSLKVIDEANDEDKVYLVSDDTRDANGQPILPVVYLGKVKDLQFSFDYTDDGIESGSITPDDTVLRAADVAQWCMNYYKGTCSDDPIGKKDEYGVVDNYRNRDQYWMEKVYKNINGTWCGFSGRHRENAGYSENLTSVDSFDEIQAVSGKPVVANYINFIRKVSLRMYDSTTGQWLIPWVDAALPTTGTDSTLTMTERVEKQKSILPLMKTNLRLVLVKPGKA